MPTVPVWENNELPVCPVNLCNDAYFPAYDAPSLQMQIHYCRNKLTSANPITLHRVRILSSISLNSQQIK